MKKIVSARMYNFDYFHKYFFKYYLSLGFDKILIFAKKQHFDIIKKSIDSSRIVLFELFDYEEPYKFEEELKITIIIYQKTLEYYERNIFPDSAYLLFADDDEFYPDIKTDTMITRAVFFEWFQQRGLNYDAEQFYNLVNQDKCKGHLQSLWNDPFYKEPIINVTVDNTILRYKIRQQLSHN